MSDDDLDEMGPVDYLVVEFPAGQRNFDGEMAAELAGLNESGTIRLLDLLILEKEEDGTIQAFEIDEVDEVDELEAEIAEILAADDVAHLAEAMLPGSCRGHRGENCWAAPFASAARRAGGRLVANGRIPTQTIVASIEADALETEQGA